ncbi:hypothetical protein NXW11_24615 [Bacteroides thetaiotaomicron]|uniref:hypothetical protein n=1 Tax=Bacteroides thetaiotaomicron TaxID=818 RepID=UPI0021668E9B|nr:hypothetical protein [Bacteroides thetaiotaomicron]MCS2621072.1 hypothetical protein [Bacteroides thetaiotaomicron]
MALARKEARQPTLTLLGTYTGAWYPSYYEVGVNFASKEYDPGKDFQLQHPNIKIWRYAELIGPLCYRYLLYGHNHRGITRKRTGYLNETDSQAQSGTWYCRRLFVNIYVDIER